jgi:hypothetical protein
MSDDLTALAAAVHVVRGQRVMLDADLAALYGVETRRLNEQVKRNITRFPDAYMFQLTAEEFANLMSQIATSSSRHGGRRKLPYVFTEHGAVMLASVLNSERAVAMSLVVVRTFVALRDQFANNAELRKGTSINSNSVIASEAKQSRNLDISTFFLDRPTRGLRLAMGSSPCKIVCHVASLLAMTIYRSARNKLEALERTVGTHDQAIAGLIDAIRQLMQSPREPRRGIGFTANISELKG